MGVLRVRDMVNKQSIFVQLHILRQSMVRKQDENAETKETAQQERDWDMEQEGTRFCSEQEQY